MLRVGFHAGTLVLSGADEHLSVLPDDVKWDGRSKKFRAPAFRYADIIRVLVSSSIPFEDEAKQFIKLDLKSVVHREPRPFQKEALQAWQKNHGRGVVVLPTGAGKSHVAVMAMEMAKRSTLVVAPTLDLVHQWFELLKNTFGTQIGVMGGGDFDVQDVTVTTYDSAYLHMENLGHRFGLLIFDECHHLPSETYSLSALFSLAPYRLGLTATLERDDDKHLDLQELIGPTVYKKEIVELSGEYLADYETVRLTVELTEEERKQYLDARAIYLGFIRQQGIRMGSPSGWADFIMRSSRSAAGKRAFQAYQTQRNLGFAASAKLQYIEMLLHHHRVDRAIIFTQDNATAYGISKRFLIPVITHKTKVKERSAILEGLASGKYSAVVTSKVLNEGVDVPSANVAIVVSGSGSVREHVQRLGRVLRKQKEKRAVLYELVTSGTSEASTSERRREHIAYR